MRAWLCSTMAVLAACGSSSPAVPDAAPADAAPPDAPPDAAPPGPAFAAAADLAIVAHPDDDLVFLQPALYDAVHAATGVTIIYVTASATGLQTQISGLQAAYSAIAGNAAWACGDVALASSTAVHCRLAAAKLSLIFLGYPDGAVDGSAPTSLLNLWEANISSVKTVAQPPSTYTQATLIATLAQLIDVTAPTTLHTLEIAATHGRDESDHMLVGALAVLATAASSQAPAIVSARGDNISDAAANVDPAVATRDTDPLARYAACATGCAPCGQACTSNQLDADQLGRLARSYPIAMHPGAGQLHTDGGCASVTAAGANASIVDCAGAPSWTLDAHGQLRASSALCLRALFTGEIVATPCTDDGVGGRWFFDDDGHLWSGLPPIPEVDMTLAHLDCLVVAGGRPRAALCGAARAPVWQLTP